MKTIENPKLAEYSSIHIGGLGNFLYLPETENELVEQVASRANLVVLGGGTNVIFADSFQGEVLGVSRLTPFGISRCGGRFTVAAGVKLARVVHAVSRDGWCGIEALAGIPGTVGGAVVMNAGSRYGAISEYISSVRVVSRGGGRVMTLQKDELDFSYRYSALQQNSDYIVLGVELEFTQNAPVEIIAARISEIIRQRVTSGIRLPNCGSVFKNPEHELSAGAMIDRLGYRGYAVGGVAVSEAHGNIMVNIGGGMYRDFQDLVALIRERVYTEYKVELELEIRVIH